MHPALSVIFFTVFSGFGYGLAALLGVARPDPALLSVKLGHILAFAAISLGLLSSTLHLKNPGRAWRAFSQWRSSWLSREGVLALAAFLPLSVQTAAAVFYGQSLSWLGAVTAVLCITTVYTTSMIYASLKTVHAWHTPLTSACYLGFALCGGALGLAAIAGALQAGYIYGAFCALLLAWGPKALWCRRLDGEKSASTITSATGLEPLAQVRLLERPHTQDNYLTREMGYHIARKHAQKLRFFAHLFGLVLPALGLAALLFFKHPAFGAAALFLHLLGVFIERWLFFAEARHTVSLYYGAASA